MTSDELKIIVNRSPPTNCDLDPVPTRLLKEQLDCIMLLLLLAFPRPMEGNEVTPIFRSLQNCQFHHRRLESLAHFNVLIYIILSTTVSNFGPYGCLFLQCLFFVYISIFACVLCI